MVELLDRSRAHLFCCWLYLFLVKSFIASPGSDPVFPILQLVIWDVSAAVNLVYPCRPAAEEEAHRQRHCGHRVPGGEYALCARHDPVQLPARIRGGAGGERVHGQRHLQGWFSRTPNVLSAFDTRWPVKTHFRFTHSLFRKLSIFCAALKRSTCIKDCAHLLFASRCLSQRGMMYLSSGLLCLTLPSSKRSAVTQNSQTQFSFYKQTS